MKSYLFPRDEMTECVTALTPLGTVLTQLFTEILE